MQAMEIDFRRQSILKGVGVIRSMGSPVIFFVYWIHLHGSDKCLDEVTPQNAMQLKVKILQSRKKLLHV